MTVRYLSVRTRHLAIGVHSSHVKSITALYIKSITTQSLIVTAAT